MRKAMAGDDDPLTGVRDCIPELDVDQRVLCRLGAGGELESEASDDQRLSVVLEERRGELARLGEATGGASVNIEGVCCLATGGGTATVQILVEGVTATRCALQNAGLEVSDERVELAYTTFGGGQARPWGRRLRDGARGGLTQAPRVPDA